mmetsp:Transcript_48691/g.150338  ORF Transcript_48691/g.150338 Transcript_48691/m.150338 type:complete len:259 (+) Transcript_48691:1082-1858(+)
MIKDAHGRVHGRDHRVHEVAVALLDLGRRRAAERTVESAAVHEENRHVAAGERRRGVERAGHGSTTRVVRRRALAGAARAVRPLHPAVARVAAAVAAAVAARAHGGGVLVGDAGRRHVLGEVRVVVFTGEAGGKHRRGDEGAEAVELVAQGVEAFLQLAYLADGALVARAVVLLQLRRRSHLRRHLAQRGQHQVHREERDGNREHEDAARDADGDVAPADDLAVDVRLGHHEEDGQVAAVGVRWAHPLHADIVVFPSE